MATEPEKLFVYGTFLQGEPRNHHLEDLELIQAFEVPGKLYDTQRGYPAALFDGDPNRTVTGELYTICREKNEKFEKLDEVEGTQLGLYTRKILKYKGYKFHLYEAGELLRHSLKKESKIKSGNWRRYGSTALKDPVEFALNFENHQSRRYREYSPPDSRGLIFLRGEIPILITAPHATRHVRMGIFKFQEEYTGALSIILHVLTGSHALYTHWASNTDPNYYDDAPFKRKLQKVVKKFGIKFVLDLHGTRRDWKEDIYPGIGDDREFLLGNSSYLHELEKSAKFNKLTLGGLNVFPASRQMTVTKFVARNLGIPAMQIEINERLRHPESNPSAFNQLIEFLHQFVLKIA
ncbi:MAG TPA: gamma-glutamylcyclotransferase family protein [Thermodesulfobacteriota bacterium]|nr:gamma-glutamylcyclotransferase family protein [Thermodesulfobacteriota bacterium]